jgi:hypothetical protein
MGNEDTPRAEQSTVYHFTKGDRLIPQNAYLCPDRSAQTPFEAPGTARREASRTGVSLRFSQGEIGGLQATKQSPTRFLAKVSNCEQTRHRDDA